MAKGSAFLLKTANGDGYSTVAGLRVTKQSIVADTVATTDKDSTKWRELLSEAGVRQVSISASGIFLGSPAEAEVRASALSGTINDYELSFEDGERIRGKFLIKRLDYAGDFNGERNYAIQLESSGPVVAAPFEKVAA